MLLRRIGRKDEFTTLAAVEAIGDLWVPQGRLPCFPADLVLALFPASQEVPEAKVSSFSEPLEISIIPGVVAQWYFSPWDKGCLYPFLNYPIVKKRLSSIPKNHYVDKSGFSKCW